MGDDALSGGLNDEKIPGGPGLNERELWSLHRAVPGLRRHDPRTSTMRMHYYVEVCCFFVILVFFFKGLRELIIGNALQSTALNLRKEEDGAA